LITKQQFNLNILNGDSFP